MNLHTAFCHTCNARERIIERGRCVVCGNRPDQKGTSHVVSTHWHDGIGWHEHGICETGHRHISGGPAEHHPR